LLDIEVKIAAVIKGSVVSFSNSISGLTEEQTNEANAKVAETQKELKK
jgi:hypothetical protein